MMTLTSDVFRTGVRVLQCFAEWNILRLLARQPGASLFKVNHVAVNLGRNCNDLFETLYGYAYGTGVCFQIDFLSAINERANGSLESLSDVDGLLWSDILDNNTDEHRVSLDDILNARCRLDLVLDSGL